LKYGIGILFATVSIIFDKFKIKVIAIVKAAIIVLALSSNLFFTSNVAL
jgi:hypothetical protein